LVCLFVNGVFQSAWVKKDRFFDAELDPGMVWVL